jgi:hypothetical protein
MGLRLSAPPAMDGAVMSMTVVGAGADGYESRAFEART